jgi:hypothetical protein
LGLDGEAGLSRIIEYTVRAAQRGHAKAQFALAIA